MNEKLKLVGYCSISEQIKEDGKGFKKSSNVGGVWIKEGLTKNNQVFHIVDVAVGDKSYTGFLSDSGFSILQERLKDEQGRYLKDENGKYLYKENAGTLSVRKVQSKDNQEISLVEIVVDGRKFSGFLRKPDTPIQKAAKIVILRMNDEQIKKLFADKFSEVTKVIESFQK